MRGGTAWQLYHYFKGDKPTEYCNVCVGEFMTALQDIKDPATGVQQHARAEQVPSPPACGSWLPVA